LASGLVPAPRWGGGDKDSMPQQEEHVTGEHAYSKDSTTSYGKENSIFKTTSVNNQTKSLLSVKLSIHCSPQPLEHAVYISYIIVHHTHIPQVSVRLPVLFSIMTPCFCSSYCLLWEFL
jgi:hypothetical protein